MVSLWKNWQLYHNYFIFSQFCYYCKIACKLKMIDDAVVHTSMILVMILWFVIHYVQEKSHKLLKAMFPSQSAICTVEIF